MQPTYRQYLQSQSDAGNQDAGRLLQVVGDDFQVDQGVLNMLPGTFYQGGYTINPGTISGINDYFSEQYRNDTEQYQGGNVLSTGTAVSGGVDTSGIDAKVQGLDALLGTTRGQKDSALTLIDDQYDGAKANLDLGYQGGLRNIDAAQGQLDTTKKRGLGTLYKNARNILQATNNQLGTFGAGDSSASQITVPHAMNQATNASISDFLGDVSQNQTAIDLKKQDVEDARTIQIRDLDLWKADRVNTIVTEFDSIIREIENEMLTANASRAQALQGASQQVLNNAVNALDGVQQTYVQTGNQILNGVTGPQQDLSVFNGPIQQQQLSVRTPAAGLQFGASPQRQANSLQVLLPQRSDEHDSLQGAGATGLQGSYNRLQG